MMKAVIIKEPGKAALTEVKKPSMRKDYFRVKTKAVASNPTDFHHTTGIGRIGGILGCDLSGVVDEIGEDCKSDMKKGDPVYGLCHCANHNQPEDGSFAEYAMVKDGHIAKIPDSISFEEAATLPTGLTTVGQALYMSMKLPLPTEPAKTPFPVLIYGGSTATGSLAVQYAKLSGLTVITTSSPDHFDMLKSRGADAVFDYRDPECAKQIRDYTKNSLHYALDNVSTESSFKIIADAMSSEPKEELQVATLLPADAWPRKDVKVHVIAAYTTFGEAYDKFGQHFPAFLERYDFGVMFWKIHSKLLFEGKIKPHPSTVRKGGLYGVLGGILDMASGKVRGTKLVYTVSETPELSECPETEVSLGMPEGPSIKKW